MSDNHIEYGACDNYGPNGTCSKCCGTLERPDGSLMTTVTLNTWGDRSHYRHVSPELLPTPALLRLDNDPNREICAKCGLLYEGHISNCGTVYPCWTRSGQYRPAPIPSSAPISSSPTPASERERCVHGTWPPSACEHCRRFNERPVPTLHLQHAEQAAKIVELEAELAAINARKFPIQNGPDIPWSLIAPFEKQARHNHGGQTLERLAERGGLSVCEALHILAAIEWHGPDSYAIRVLPLRDQILRLSALAARSPSGNQ